MIFKNEAATILEEVEHCNLSVENKIASAKVYAILDLADAIRNK